MSNGEIRSIGDDSGEIRYFLERKPVKNLNLRIHCDGTVAVSAAPSVPAAAVDTFVASHKNRICSARKRFAARAVALPLPKEYIGGESFLILGRQLRLRVEQGVPESADEDGVYLTVRVADPSDFRSREKAVCRFYNELSRRIFGETTAALFPLTEKYGVAMPSIRIRRMRTRWGSCLPEKGMITLNSRLIEMPPVCIEYVILHELCHFVYPNHSRRFYDFITMLMPDWKERKSVLNTFP